MGATVFLSGSSATAGSAGGGGTVIQDSPTSGSTSTASSAGFTDQLSTNFSGTVTFATTSTPNGVEVSSSGAVSTSGTLAVGSYTVSGTDSGTVGDVTLASGTWSYTLTVGAVTIAQNSPISNSTTTTGSSGFISQLVATAPGTVTFATTSTPNGVEVSSSGAVSTSGTLAVGSYTVSGTDSDAWGDSGTWSYTLTVSAASQVITFTSTPPSPSTDGGSYTVSAAIGASGNPVTFSSSTTSVCTVSDSTVSFVGIGTCTIDANEAGNADYAAAATARQSFAVAGSSQSVDPTSTVPGATTVPTGEPWAGSRPWEIIVGTAGVGLLACGELRRRKYRNADHPGVE